MYGWDLGEKRGLAELVRDLASVEGIEWIRFLYTYPNTIYDELLDAVAETEKVCNYIDMPLQSASREVLKRMKRGGNRGSLERLIGRIRGRVPEVTLRTTLIVGFPGETETDFQELLDFVEGVQFDRLGVFAYSDEEDSETYSLEGKDSDTVKKERVDRVMELQAGISKAKNKGLVDRKFPLLVEGPSSETDMLWEGRLKTQAPEIDGVVYLNDGVTAETRPGEIRTVHITGAFEYDLIGTLLK